MKPFSTKRELRIRAAEALRAVLAEVSGVKVREIRHASTDAGGTSAFTVSVDVYGRNHTLACEIASDGQPAHLRLLLEGLCNSIASTCTAATPVIIAPHISDEARAMCKESQAGYLDLDGNARIALGEVFILRRIIPHAARHSIAPEAARPAVSHHAA
jgi:hypothetical protein